MKELKEYWIVLIEVPNGIHYEVFLREPVTNGLEVIHVKEVNDG